MFPIPSDYLSVEMGAPSETPSAPPPQQQQPAVSLPPVSLPPVSLPPGWRPPGPFGDAWRPPGGLWVRPVGPPASLPELHRLANGHGLVTSAGSGISGGVGEEERLADRLEDIMNGSGGGPERRGAKRPLESGEESDAAMELRRLEHECKMRLLRREAECMAARHALEMQVLEQQREFWSEALKKTRRGATMPFGL